MSGESSDEKGSAAAAEGGHEFTNRLAKEQSPYLLQHAHNPVDWYPWGDEAFEKAKSDNKPIFLSIGYSTCHWCHVMEHESFESKAIAELLNKEFVCIKVDREERPDVDKVYMTFVQATNKGRGGWPLTVFLTPDLKPFVGGTYFPPHDKFGQPGLTTVVGRVSKVWREDSSGFMKHSEDVLKALSRATEQFKKSTDEISNDFVEKVVGNCYETLAGTFDAKLGGFGDAPKFPRPSVFNFLFKVYAKHGNQSPGPEALEMCTFTLRQMAKGGMHDHIGGGFHRYSVDAYFHVPHFEKMLYDNAQLAVSYLTAFQITRDPFFKEIAESIFRYIKRDMTHPDGGIFSAEDADSLHSHDSNKKEEGAFYVWSLKEVKKILGEEDGEIFADHFYIKEGGNADLSPLSDPRKEFAKLNILIEYEEPGITHKNFNLTSSELKEKLEICKQKLFEVRKERPRPGLDDKIITAWNGQMISAFSKAHQILHFGCLEESDDQKSTSSSESEYLNSAINAANFIKLNLTDEEGFLFRNFRKTASQTKAFISDYASLIRGLLDLYEASFDVQWLKWAVDLQEKQDVLFLDSESGGYFSTTTSDPSILLRMKDDYDGAEPSANSVAASNLLRFSKLFSNDKQKMIARDAISSLKERLEGAPIAVPEMCASLEMYSASTRQVVLSGSLNPPSKNIFEFLRVINSQYSPNTILALTDGAENQSFLSEMYDFYRELKPSKDGLTTAYLCENFVCQMPTTNPEVLQTSMNSSNKL